MDVEKLHNSIHSSLSLNPIFAAHLPNPTAPNWTLDESGLLRQYDRIYIPDANDLRLKVLQYKHDHILSRHFGQKKNHILSMTRICVAQPPNLCANILQILHNLHAFEVTPPQTLWTFEATSDHRKTVELHFHRLHRTPPSIHRLHLYPSCHRPTLQARHFYSCSR